MTGRLVHFELPADDTGEAREFWRALLGWEFERFPGVDYHLTRIDERTGGAIAARDGSRRGPRAYFEVEDVARGAARVRELGGEASEPMPVPGMGWFVVCSDTQGNEFGLWHDDSTAPVPAT